MFFLCTVCQCIMYNKGIFMKNLKTLLAKPCWLWPVTEAGVPSLIVPNLKRVVIVSPLRGSTTASGAAAAVGGGGRP